MDTTDTAISFDEAGVCDHCRTFDKDIASCWHNDGDRFSEFEMQIERMKQAGRGA